MLAITDVFASSDNVLAPEQGVANVRSSSFRGCICIRMIFNEICLYPAIVCRHPGGEQLYSGPVSEPRCGTSVQWMAISLTEQLLGRLREMLTPHLWLDKACV